MKRIGLSFTLIACMVTPVLGQDIVFFDDFEVDTGYWHGDTWSGPVDARAVDPLDPANQAIRPWGPTSVPEFPGISVWSAPIPVDMASTYVLSFRFLDESPEFQTGCVSLRVDPGGAEEHVMPFQLIADGSWHEYSFEFIPGELFDPGSSHITVCLTGQAVCQIPPGHPYWDTCVGETFNYYDDFIIELTESVPSESLNWGNVKARFR